MDKAAATHHASQDGDRLPPAPGDDELLKVRTARRGKARIARLHHHAVGTRDMEKTRQFYEDILGMPMVSALKETINPTTGEWDPYLHCFFEMKDGSCLAFFQFARRGPTQEIPRNGFDLHIAVSVPDFDDLQLLKDRLEEAGYATAGIDHGFCYSVYVRDPNGMTLELTADPANELQINEDYARTAHEEYQSWMTDQDYEANNKGRDGGIFPMKTSSPEEIQAAIG